MFTFVTKDFKEDAKNFSKYNFEKNYQKSMTIGLIGALITFILSVLMIVLKESLVVSIILLVGSIALLVYGYILYRVLTKAQSNITFEKINEVVTTFNKNNFEVVTKYVENSQASATQEYSQIERIEENDKYFFLFISKVAAYTIRKDSIQSGTISDFRKFLRKEKNFEIITKQEKTSTKNRQRRRQESKIEKKK